MKEVRKISGTAYFKPTKWERIKAFVRRLIIRKMINILQNAVENTKKMLRRGK